MYLARGQEVSQRINNVPLDCAFQVPRAIFQFRAFAQQEIARRRSHAEEELPLGRIQHAPLHHGKLDFQNLLELDRAQGMEHHHFIQPVHEFG